MSPSRPSNSRRNSSGGFKPYTRSSASAAAASTALTPIMVAPSSQTTTSSSSATGSGSTSPSGARSNSGSGSGSGSGPPSSSARSSSSSSLGSRSASASRSASSGSGSDNAGAGNTESIENASPSPTDAAAAHSPLHLHNPHSPVPAAAVHTPHLGSSHFGLPSSHFPSQSQSHQSHSNTPPPPPPPSHIAERPGFPTYAQYKQVEAAYLRSLTPRRQGKALISQRMFDRIWDVLHQPDAPGETAQFRFWARKMFTVRVVGGVPGPGAQRHAGMGGVGVGGGGMGAAMGMGMDGMGTGMGSPDGFGGGMGPGDAPGMEPQEVLLHDNLLVAIQEQLYDLLCYCHGSTGHGGRDKTCALIRKHYTWVPKDLVSSFIKTCPTCIMKKCGGGGVGVGMGVGGVGMNMGVSMGMNMGGVNMNMSPSLESQQREMERQMEQHMRQQEEEEHHRLQMQQHHYQQQQQQHHQHHQHQQQRQQHQQQQLPGMRDFFQNMYGMDLGVPSSPHPHPHQMQGVGVGVGVPWPTMGDGGHGSPSEQHAMSPTAMSMSMSVSLSMSGSGSGSGSGSASIGASGHGAGSPSGLDSASSMSMSMHDGSGGDSALEGSSGTGAGADSYGRNLKPHLQHGRYPTHPMVREVALYKGLPNGWQYRHADYASAHAEFMSAKAAAEAEGGMDGQTQTQMQMHLGGGDMGMQRPRVPSILPLWGPDKFTQAEYEAIAAANAEQLQGLSPVLTTHFTTGDEAHDGTNSVSASGASHAQGHFASGAEHMSLQYLLMHAPKEPGTGTPLHVPVPVAVAKPYSPQIDPVLLGYSASGSGSGSDSPGAGLDGTSDMGAEPSSDPASASLGSSSRFPSSPSIKRAAAAPLRIQLEFPPPEKSFQALLAYRDSMGDGNLTPDSPLLGWGPNGSALDGGHAMHGAQAQMHMHMNTNTHAQVPPASPTPSLRSDGSGGSQLSQLSAFRVSLADDSGGDVSPVSVTSNDSTPASSALPTPVDEFGSGAAAADIKGQRKMVMGGDGIVVADGDGDVDVAAEAQTRLEQELSEGIQIALGLQAA